MEEEKLYRWCRIRNKNSYCGAIQINVVKNQDNNISNQIIEEYQGQGWISQGDIEEVPAIGYDSWKIGVRNGLSFAFSKSQDTWRVYIKKLEGLTTDTNPTIAGYIAIQAFWEKIKFNPNQEETHKIEEFVFNSWGKKLLEELIPDFFTCTFEVYKQY